LAYDVDRAAEIFKPLPLGKKDKPG